MDKTDVPRFVQVTEAPLQIMAINLDRIGCVATWKNHGFQSRIWDSKGNEWIGVIDPVDVVLARIREVGGIVSSYGGECVLGVRVTG